MTERSRAQLSSRWLAAALVALPFWQLSGLDADRSGVLVLLLPALWTGRFELFAAVQQGWQEQRRIWILGITITAVAVLSASLSTHTAASLVMTARWILLAATAVLAGRLWTMDPNATSRQWLSACAGSAALGGIIVWVAWFTGHRQPFPFYFHARHLGYHALIGTVAGIALVLSQPRRTPAHIFGAIAATISWAGVFWSGGRASMLGLGAALAAWLIASPPTQRRRLILTCAAVGVVGTGLAHLLATPGQAIGLANAVERTVQARTVYDFTSVRSTFWLASWKHFLESPIFGLGPDAYVFLLPKLDGPHPHNLILQCLLDLGVVGAIPALTLLGLALVRGWRSPATSIERQAWVAMLTGGVVLSMLDGPFYHLVGFLPLSIAIGICLFWAISPQPAAETRWPAFWFPRLFASAAIVASLLLLFHTWLYSQVSSGSIPPGPKADLPLVWRAFPSTTQGVARWFAAWSEKQPDVALAWTEWTIKRTPDAPLYRVLAARLLIAQGRREEARKELEIALAVAHYSQRNYVTMVYRELFGQPPPGTP